MKNKRIEAIVATAIYLFILVIISSRLWHGDSRGLVAVMGYCTVIYAAFMAFTQWISPRYFRLRQIDIGVFLTLLLFFATWFAVAFCIWQRDYVPHTGERFWSQLTGNGESLGLSSIVLLTAFAYEGIKRGIRYFCTTNLGLASRIGRDSLIVLAMAILLFILSLNINGRLAGLFLFLTPYAYVAFAVNVFWFIPLCEKKRTAKHLYVILMLLLSLLLYIPFGTCAVLSSDMSGAVFILCWALIAIAVLPLSHVLYRQQKQHIAQLVSLKTELGHASADLQHLRSQINPHFLFNILNTLYGTALQERAERTATGIQKLGDMMRFMLHENNQDHILLAREIAYLRNYIDLQLLRTAGLPEVWVDVDIAEVLDGRFIAPMLLIPFVENAFKHGISLQERSWIKLNLKEADGKLYFDAYNSLHVKPENDPEKWHSGIGLENVRQRLELLYPDRYELVIRETKQEFFVHLTIAL